MDSDLNVVDALPADLSLHAIVDSIPGLVAVMTSDGGREHVNAQLLDFFGKTLEELNGWEADNLVHPEDFSLVTRVRGNAMATGTAYEMECRYRRKDGLYRWCHTRGFPLRDAEERILRWFVVVNDVDDRKAAETLLAGENRLLGMIAGRDSLDATLEELCRLVENTANGCRCAVFLLDEARTQLERAVSASMPETFVASMIGMSVESDCSPASMACRENEQVIAADLATEQRWSSGWRSIALSHGVRACWATPISSSAGSVLGAFAIYYDGPRQPTTLQLRLIEQFTDIARIAVERAHTDAALTTSEARKAAILDSSLDCIVTIDHEGRITEFNLAAERTFGYSRQEVIGRLLTDVLVPDRLRERQKLEFSHFLSGESALIGKRIETFARRADGVEIPVELAITKIDLDGPPSFTGFLRDITDRKRAIDDREWAETQLAGEKRLLEMIASGRSLHEVLTALCNFVEDAAPDCVCGVYPIDWSGPFFHGSIAPSLPASYVDPIEGLAVRCDVAPCGIAALTKSQVIVEDVDTDPQWIGTPYRDHLLAHGLRSVWSTPVHSLVGEVLGTFAIYQRKPASPSPQHRDLIAQVTHIASVALERAQAEAALKRSEAFLAQGERLSLTGTFAWRIMTGEITWSEQVYRIFDIDPRTPVTLDLIRARLHPDDMHMFHEIVERARTDVRELEIEYRLQLPGGAIKHLRIVARPTRDHDGRLEYIGAVQDVTDRRRSEEALGKVRSELAHVARVTTLGTLTASIAHEVNQPLAGIVTNASTCLRMLDADPPNVLGARETARRSIRDALRASEVITRLRALFSKNGVSMELIDLNEATREVIALSHTELRRSRTTLRAELAENLPSVSGDRVQLQQVILNLILNAADAMRSVDDRPRQAVITTRADADGVRVSVRDAGEGLNAQPIERMFEPFYTTKRDGMGMGLAVSRSIIESHRGRIWATPNDGAGTTFSFSIPRSH